MLAAWAAGNVYHASKEYMGGWTDGQGEPKEEVRELMGEVLKF